MNDSNEHTIRFRVADLSQNSPTQFEVRPNKAYCDVLKDDLGLGALRKLSFVGDIRGTGDSDWKLSAKLGATVVQPCIVTLEPVTTRVEIQIKRHFVAQIIVHDSDEDEAEIEMPDDENADLLGSHIDVSEIMAETLALNLPPYPRAENAELSQAVFTEPGQKPMKDEDARPFAGLAGLRDKLSDDKK